MLSDILLHAHVVSLGLGIIERHHTVDVNDAESCSITVQAHLLRSASELELVLELDVR